MANVLFIQNVFFQNLGPMYLSAAAKKAGHRVRLLLTNHYDKINQAIEGVDIVAFSAITGQHATYLDWIRRIKAVRPDIVAIMGGAHPTFYPEVLDQNPELDFICRGEGEDAFVEFCDRFPDRDTMAQVQNINGRLDETIKTNCMRAVGDVDAIAAPDRTLYGRTFMGSIQPVLASRGCPYDCTFCFVNSFRTLHKEETGKTVSVRYRTPELVIDELLPVRETARIIQFRDESFLSHRKWFEAFLTQYRDRIGVPFTCQIRVNEVTEEKARLLREANVHCVFMGIESGNEDIRAKIIKKKLSTDAIRAGAELLKKHKIPFRTYNIIGFPGETIEDVYSTIRVNQMISTDYPWVSMLMPYRGTEIHKYFDKEMFSSDGDASNLEWFFPKSAYYADKQEYINLQNLFVLAVKMKSLEKFIHKLAKLPPNPAYKLLYQAAYAWSSFKSEGYSVADFIRTGANLSFRKYCYGPF